MPPLRRLYDWTMAKAGDRRALPWLAGISFVESSFFPIPPDLLLIPMVLAERRRAWLIAGVCTLASVVGGFLGYGIGYFLFDTVGQPLIEFYGKASAFAAFRDAYAAYGAWIVFGFGLTFLPYKVVTIASGVVALDPLVFGLASLSSRGLRFFAEAVLLYVAGPKMRGFVEKRLELMTLVGFVLLFGGFLAVKFLL